jgi:hypothetical protein
MVTGCELRNPFTHRLDHARTVGHRDATHVLRVGGADHPIVMVVE